MKPAGEAKRSRKDATVAQLHLSVLYGFAQLLLTELYGFARLHLSVLYGFARLRFVLPLFLWEGLLHPSVLSTREKRNPVPLVKFLEASGMIVGSQIPLN